MRLNCRTMVLFGLAIFCLATIAAAHPVPATAADYTVWTCRGPDDQPLSTAAWKKWTIDAQPGDVTVTDDCASGGSLSIAITDLGIPTTRKPRGEALFDLPKGAIITGYRLLRANGAAPPGVPHQPPDTYGSGVTETSAGADFSQGCSTHGSAPLFDCFSEGNPADPLDPSNVYQRSGLSLDGLSVWAACTSVGCTQPQSGSAAFFTLFGSSVSIADNVAPTVDRLEGSLASGDPVVGWGDLFVESSDSGGGVASTSLLIDGVPAGTIAPPGPRGTCSEPFEVAEPCPDLASRFFRVDTVGLSVGPHVVTGVVTDAAGNSTAFGPLQFKVTRPVSPPPPPPVPDNGFPATESAELKFDRVLVEHKPGQPALLRGSLATGSGQPIAGAQLKVEVTESRTRKEVKRELKPVTTGADGRFELRLNGAGQRRVKVAYAPFLGGEVSRTAEATAKSRLVLKLKIRPKRVKRGRAIRFTGRLKGAGALAAGASVEIQAIVGGKWRSVDTVISRGNGKFSWRYRFRYVERNAIFSFRALVRGTPGWPWKSTSSKRARVRVNGFSH